jgi:TIR domain
MKGMPEIVSDIEEVVSSEALAEIYGLDTDDITNAIFQKLHSEGVTDAPALMRWSHDLLGRLNIWRILENLHLNFDKNEPTDALLTRWFSHRGIGEHLQPRVRPDELTQNLTEMAQQAAATPASFDVFRLIETPFTSLMRYISLFYWRELERNGRIRESGDARTAEGEVVGMLEELPLSELCSLLNCDAPLKARPYDPASQQKVVLSSGAASIGLSRLSELASSASASSPDQSLELAESLMTVLQEWHGDDPYTPKACAVAEIHQTSFNRRLTCYDEMGATVILNGVTSSIAYGDDVLVRWRDEGEVWASKPQAVPRNSVWQMPEIVPRKDASGRAIQARARDKVFISYSHDDSRWMERLQTHLEPYVRNAMIPVWDDSQIRAGAAWNESIEQALASAKVAVLLVSPRFLASKFIAERELPPLLAAAKREGLTILWVPVKSSAYEVTEIEKYQAAHPPEKPLASLRPADCDRALVEICKVIQQEYQR